MAEETSPLEQAFAEAGVQLDRIISAYEREKKPFVPTGFPAYAKCIDNNAGFEYIIEIQGYNGPASTGSGFIISVSNGLVTVADSEIDLFSFDANFNITLIMDNLEVEWIDPSTLPQS